MEESQVHAGVALVAHGKAAVAIEPGEEAFDLPTVAGQGGMHQGRPAPLAAMCGSAARDAVADAPASEGLPEGAAVVATIRSEPCRAAAWPTTRTGHADRGQNGGRFAKIVGVARGQVQPNGQTVAIHHDMPFAGHSTP